MPHLEINDSGSEADEDVLHDARDLDNLDNLLDGLRINGHSEGRDESQNAFPVHSDEEDNVNEDEVPDLVDDDDDDEDEDLYESVDAQSFEDYPANDYAFQSVATERSTVFDL